MSHWLEERTNSVLKLKYKEKGYKYFIDLCEKIIMSEYLKGKDGMGSRNSVVGAVAETVLEVSILEFIKNNPKKCKDFFYSKGIILKDIDRTYGEFYTEVDLVLYTPNKIFLFECKSFNGEKVVTDKGLVKVNGREFDVFKQHKNHFYTFTKIFNGFMKNSSKIKDSYYIGYFNFSVGELKDLREDKWKRIFPIVDVSNIFNVLDSINEEVNWKYNYVKKAADILESSKSHLRAEHLRYVTTLKNSREGK